jgi:hypothetical protein
MRAQGRKHGEDAGWEGIGGDPRCARRGPPSRVRQHRYGCCARNLFAAAPEVLVRLDMHTQAEEEEVVVSAMSEGMQMWGGRGNWLKEGLRHGEWLKPSRPMLLEVSGV